MIKAQVKKIPNWKSPGPDGVQGSWLKKLTALHKRIAKQMDSIISNRDDIPKWMRHTNLGRDIQIWEWHGLIIRRLMIWFPIPGYLKALNLCKCLTTSSNL